MAALKEDSVLGSNDPIEAEDKEEGGQFDLDMAPPTGNSIHRSGSRPQLDLSKAAIQGNSEDRDPTILLPNQSDDISHLALDIGGIIGSSLFFNLSFFMVF